MSNKVYPQSLSKRITIGILVLLGITNAVWVATSERKGPLIALVFYTFITLLCWRRSHFRAGIIGGIFGFGIHVYELISLGIGELDGVEPGFFFANLLLPILLTYFSYKAYQEGVRGDAEV
jgi:hypothetical protein